MGFLIQSIPYPHGGGGGGGGGGGDPYFDLTKMLLNFDGAGSSAWTDESASPVSFAVDIGSPSTSGGYLVVGGSDRIKTNGGAVKWNPNLSTQGQGSTSGDWCLEFSVIHNNADSGSNVGYIQWGDDGAGHYSCAIYHNSTGGYTAVLRGAVTGSFSFATANTFPITPGHEYEICLEKCGNRLRLAVDGVTLATNFMNEQMLSDSGAFLIGGCTIGGVNNLNGKVGPVRMTFAGRHNKASFSPDAKPYPTTQDLYAYHERDQIGWITANNANGWGGNNNTKSMVQFVVPAPGRWISKVRARVGTGTATQKVKPVLYNAYSDAATIYQTGQEYVLGHNIAGSEDVELFWNADLSASFFPPGTYGLAIICEGTGWNFSANNVTPANSTRWNADTYSDGPASPFGTGTASASSVNIFCPVSTNGPDPGAVPTFTVSPAITGSPNVGSTLTATYTAGLWGLATYQWTRGGVNIPGATLSTYVPDVYDDGTMIGCNVTLTNTHGATTQSASAVGPISGQVAYRYFLLEFASTPNGFIGCSTIKLLEAVSGTDRALSSGGATASTLNYTQNGSFPVTNCNDGNDTSFTTASSGSAAGVGHGIQIDLGAAYVIDTLGYRSRSDSFGTVEALKTGSIQAKVNSGDAWTVLRSIDETATPYGNNEYRTYAI
jgi:hypothetical protein